MPISKVALTYLMINLYNNKIINSFTVHYIELVAALNITVTLGYQNYKA